MSGSPGISRADVRSFNAASTFRRKTSRGINWEEGHSGARRCSGSTADNCASYLSGVALCSFIFKGPGGDEVLHKSAALGSTRLNSVEQPESLSLVTSDLAERAHGEILRTAEAPRREVFLPMGKIFMLFPITSWISAPPVLAFLCLRPRGRVSTPPHPPAPPLPISFVARRCKIKHCSACERGQL